MSTEVEYVGHLKTTFTIKNKVNNFKPHLCSLVKVGEFIVTNGLFVKTQDTAEVYRESTKKKQFHLHLNLVQVYIHGTTYSVYSPARSNVSCLLDTLKGTFTTALEYMDTHRDRQVLKAVMASLTSTKFAAELQGLSSPQGTASARVNVVTVLKFHRL